MDAHTQELLNELQRERELMKTHAFNVIRAIERMEAVSNRLFHRLQGTPKPGARQTLFPTADAIYVDWLGGGAAYEAEMLRRVALHWNMTEDDAYVILIDMDVPKRAAALEEAETAIGNMQAAARTMER